MGGLESVRAEYLRSANEKVLTTAETSFSEAIARSTTAFAQDSLDFTHK